MCIFCKIVSGEIPGKVIYEDNDFLAFLDVNPVVMGHTLLVSKRHCMAIYELNALQKKLVSSLD